MYMFYFDSKVWLDSKVLNRPDCSTLNRRAPVLPVVASLRVEYILVLTDSYSQSGGIGL